MSDIQVGETYQLKDDADFKCKVLLIDEWGTIRTDVPDRKTVGNKYDFAGGFSKDLFLRLFELTPEDESVPDIFNNPPHYKGASGIECIEVTRHMQFCGGNCFKYLYRAGSKGDVIEDLKKAKWYASKALYDKFITDESWLRALYAVAINREGNIRDAMLSVRSQQWQYVIKSIEAEIARQTATKRQEVDHD